MNLVDVVCRSCGWTGKRTAPPSTRCPECGLLEARLDEDPFEADLRRYADVVALYDGGAGRSRYLSAKARMVAELGAEYVEELSAAYEDRGVADAEAREEASRG